MNLGKRLTERIYGPPGTGKTTDLLRLVDEYIQAGVKPDRIAYLAFTVKAAREAIERATAKFGLAAENLPWFRTIHSLAFRALSLSSAQVLKKRHLSEICKRLGFEFSGYVELEEGSTATSLGGDRLLFLEGLSRAKMVPYEQQFEQSSEDCSWYEFELLTKALTQFKEAYHLLDFNDMLELAYNATLPDFDVLIVDEAQDLSALQWRLVEKLAERTPYVHVAGDDDQAIFRWAGADPSRFVAFGESGRVLVQSYRVPQRVHEMATGLISQVRDRPEKVYGHRPHQGNVDYVVGHEDLDLSRGQWLVLARNSYLLKDVQERCIRDGLGYVGRAGKQFVPEDYDPERTPDVRISTIHGAKGAEADNVAVFTDLSYKTYESMLANRDDELRTFYVAVTRTKENLYVICPRSNNYVDFLDL